MVEIQFISYIRVSTEYQERSGLGIEAQRDTVNKYVANAGGELVQEYVETESGKVDDRPELSKAVKNARKLGAVLIVAKLDRLSRNATFLLSFDDMVKRASIDLHVCDQPHLDRFMLGIHALVAEREREMISERTKSALKMAKAKGVQLGTRDGARLSRSGNAARLARAERFVGDVLPTINELRRSGCVNFSSIARALNTRGILAPQGGEWYAETVRRVERRACGKL